MKFEDYNSRQQEIFDLLLQKYSQRQVIHLEDSWESQEEEEELPRSVVKVGHGWFKLSHWWHILNPSRVARNLVWKVPKIENFRFLRNKEYVPANTPLLSFTAQGFVETKALSFEITYWEDLHFPMLISR